MLNVILL
jgi:hypothetical protein